jgi:hypothetical protein
MGKSSAVGLERPPNREEGPQYLDQRGSKPTSTHSYPREQGVQWSDMPTINNVQVEDGELDLEDDERIIGHYTDQDLANLMFPLLRQEKENPGSFEVNTMYKPKARKVQPVDDSALDDKTTPPGNPKWKEEALDRTRDKLESPELSKRDGPFENIYPRFADSPRGSRLTDERLAELLGQLSDTELTDQEVEVFKEVLYRREMALAWDFAEIGRIHEEVAPDYEIRTVPHQAWQARSIKIPEPLKPKVYEALRKRIKHGVLEEAHGPYRNGWFVVEKKDGGIRLINSATKLNGQTIRDAMLPRATDEFASSVAMCVILSMVDFFSGYDQVRLAENCRNLTAFSTDLGLYRMTTLPQGHTNSVGHFLRVVCRILIGLMPERADAFFDDVTVKGPITRYEEAEVFPGIRRFVLEHLENIDATLLAFELAGACASGVKSKWCKKSTVVLGYLCGTNGRRPEEAKVIKIKEFKPCTTVKGVRSFLGCTVYYKIWIKGYSIIIMPLTLLLRKNAQFVWGYDQQAAFDMLKQAMTSAPILVTLDYSPGAGRITLRTDASGEGWGGILSQLINGKEHPSRYESGVWRGAELNYDATKAECLAVVKSLRRFRNYLYGVRFTLETDAKVLIYQLNDSFSSLPGASLTRWVAYIKMFDFEVKHFPGKTNHLADALSRKGEGPSDFVDDQWEGEVDDFIDIQLSLLYHEQHPIHQSDATNPACLQINALYAMSNTVEFSLNNVLIPAAEWSDHSQEIAEFLTTLKLPDQWKSSTAQEKRRLKTEALKFCVREGRLWRKPERRFGERRVIDTMGLKRDLLNEFHTNLGHRGRDSTYHRIATSYWWKNMYAQIEEALRACPKCQACSEIRPRDYALSTVVSDILVTWVLDVQFMPNDRGYIAIVEARCETSAFIEAKPLKKVDSKSVCAFIMDHIVHQHGAPMQIKLDNGSENKKDVMEACKTLGIIHSTGPAYDPERQGTIEVGHKSIKHSLMTDTDGTGKGWVSRLQAALYADRTATRPYGYCPYEVVYHRHPISPIEAAIPSWRVINWEAIKTHEDLVAAKSRMLMRPKVDVDKIAKFITKRRRAAAERLDQRNKHRLRPTALLPGELVLLYDTPRHIDMSTSKKLNYRWEGPFFIVKETAPNAFVIREPHGVEKRGVYPGHRLKHFVRDTNGYWETADPEEDIWMSSSERPLSEDDDQGEEEEENESQASEREDWRVVGDKVPKTNIRIDIPSKPLEGYAVIED